MGAQQSSNKDGSGEKKPYGLVRSIDFIATNYIMSQDFKDLKRLANKEYCDKLVIMTGNVLNEYLDTQDVEYLSQKIRDGTQVDEMNKEKLTYFEKDNVGKLDIKSEIVKKRMCIGIAGFYVKIAHLFAAILTTVNPQYKYTDNSGVRRTVPIDRKKEIPEGVSAKLTRSNLCSTRIQALLGGQKVDAMTGEVITIKPSFCGMNRAPGGSRSLYSEPGIPELKKLYYDVYDFETGTYKSMSEKSKKQYREDVHKLYKVFTGADKVPPGINNYGDIKLKDYHNSDGCQLNGVYEKLYRGSVKDKLFVEYVSHIKEMSKSAETNQNRLLEILDVLFAFSTNPNTLQREITVNPALNAGSLQKAVEDTRNIILAIYMKCEKDFIKGLQIFEAIVEKQIMETATVRVDNLRLNMEEQVNANEDDEHSGAVTPKLPEDDRGNDAPAEPAAPSVPGPVAPSVPEQAEKEKPTETKEAATGSLVSRVDQLEDASRDKALAGGRSRTRRGRGRRSRHKRRTRRST